jgi:hypothetical protein
VETLSGAWIAGMNVRLAMNGDGAAVVSWADRDSRVQARHRASDGAFGPILTLALRGWYPVGDVDDAGNAFVVWDNRNGLERQVQGRAISSAGALGRVLKLSDPYTGYSGGLELATAPDGSTLVVWSRQVGPRDWDLQIEGRFRSADGSLGPIEAMSPADEPGEIVHDVAIDPNGNAVIGWEGFILDETGDLLLQTANSRARRADGQLGPVQALHDRIAKSAGARVALDADGRAIAAWGSINPAWKSRVYAAVGP